MTNPELIDGTRTRNPMCASRKKRLPALPIETYNPHRVASLKASIVRLQGKINREIRDNRVAEAQDFAPT